MIAALCAGFAAVCFFALGWLFSSWFNEKHDKTITTFTPAAEKFFLPPAAEKFFLPLADRRAIQTAIPYLKSTLLELEKKQKYPNKEWRDWCDLCFAIDKLKKLIECSVPIYDNR